MKRMSLLEGLIVTIGLASLTGSARATLVAGWDFQTTATGGTAAVSLADPNFPRVYNANVGAGALYLDETHGSSNWVVSGASGVTELNAYGGTAVNADQGLSSVTSSPASLALVNKSANGKSAVFAFDMTGYSGLTVSYATQRTKTGFDSQQWDFSTDGANWTPLSTQSALPTSFGLITLPTTSGLDNAATSYLRLTVAGNTSDSGNNRLDNIKFEATPAGGAIPEPGTFGLLAIGLVPVGSYLRRRR